MTSKRSMFRVAIVGNRHFPRYAVVDNRRSPNDPPHYWTGRKEKVWSTDWRDAMTWINTEFLVTDMRDIVRYELRDQPARRFVLTIDVELIGGQNVTPEQLQAYLDRALDIQIDYTGQGMGPIKGSAVLLSGDTSTLNEIDATPQED